MEICYYDKKTDGKIIQAVKSVLKTGVISCVKMKNGDVNHVFKITTAKGEVIARIFKFENWPEDGKLEWIERRLAKNKIPHAKLLFFTRDKRYFPHGFMISEFIEGEDGFDAIKNGCCTIAQSYFEKGKILKKVHQIKVKKFGPINEGKGKSLNFLNYKLERANRFLNRLAADKMIKTEVIGIFNEKVEKILGPYNKDFKPVLIHGDATRKNTIWSKKNGLMLIDWDNAWSGIWLWDFIELSWWWRHLKSWKDKGKRKTARAAFFRGYGKTACSSRQIDKIERGLHLIKSVERLHYFYYDRENPRFLRLVKKFFLEELYK
ncbi:MAG: aminoglycoside phosphotransferase family protein [Patescibacteria group bacterium]|jgi:Ser/Thr protein kinase RdoA (MazF antagonist)